MNWNLKEALAHIQLGKETRFANALKDVLGTMQTILVRLSHLVDGPIILGHARCSPETGGLVLLGGDDRIDGSKRRASPLYTYARLQQLGRLLTDDLGLLGAVTTWRLDDRLGGC